MDDPCAQRPIARVKNICSAAQVEMLSPAMRSGIWNSGRMLEIFKLYTGQYN
jgi:hypothetical protein